MTATDELHRMLDERGVEWERGLPTETIVRKPIDVLYVERPDGRIHAYVRSYLTPEQAIAATLGAVEYRKPTTLSQLEAENAKLRDGAAKMAQWYDEELKAALAENSKLRELVRALLTCATNGECDECRMNGATPWHVGEAQLCDGIWEHLRELGVEVDE